MHMPIVFMFSGQGSQYYQMGRELYEGHPRFKLWMDHCDEIAEPLIEASLIDVIYRGGKKAEPFDRVLYTTPALLGIEYSLARLLGEMGIHADYLLGYSLGELTACIVSGAMSLEQGMRLAVDYAKLLEDETQPAGMLAIVGSEDLTLEFPELFRNCPVTGRNFRGNFVVSGLVADVQCLQDELTRIDVASQRLPVNYGFHTELMDPIEDKFRELVRRTTLHPIGIRTISTLRATEIQEVTDKYLWEVTRYPVAFEETIGSMLKGGDYVYVDVGPSGSLSTFIKYLLPAGASSLPLEVMNQFGRDLKSIEALRKCVPLAAS